MTTTSPFLRSFHAQDMYRLVTILLWPPGAGLTSVLSSTYALRMPIIA